jgi:hypothetical protein
VLPVVSVASTAPSRSRAATATSASISGVFLAMVRPLARVTPIPQNLHWSSVPQYVQVCSTVLATESRCSRAICQYGMPDSVVRS